MESFVLTAGLLFISSTIITYLGKTAAGLLKVALPSFLNLPFGFALVLSVGFLSFKANIPWVIAPIFMAILLIPAFITPRVGPLSSLFSRENLQNGLRSLARTLLFPAISAVSVSLVVVFQNAVMRGQVPLLTSFDTTSGDMFSYLILADGLRNVGWEGQLAHVESGVFDTGLGNLSLAFEHAGAGGYVSLALFATVLGLKTWMVGTLVLLLSLQSIVMAASGILNSQTKLDKWQSFLLGNLAFGSFAYLTVVGWWAMNQIILTLLFLLSLWFISVTLSNRELRATPKYFLILGTLMALSLEVYPSVAFYSLLPIFIVSVGVAIFVAIRTNAWAILPAISSFVPLTYGLLGTFQFLPQIFSAQFDQKLDMGYRASGFFDFLGLPNSVALSFQFPNFKWLLEVTNSAFFWGGSFFALVCILLLRHKAKFKLLLPFALAALGGSALLGYTGFISPTSYLAHKLSLMWYPVVILCMLVLVLQNYELSQKRSPFLKRIGKISLPIIIVSNSLAASYFFSTAVNSPDARQLHTITNEALELRDQLQSLDAVAIMTDFSAGHGWGALDRTILPAIVTYPGKTVESGGYLAGYPYYSGWTVSSTSKSILAPSEGYVNEYYSLKFVCRLVCAPRELGISVFVAGLPTTPSEMDAYKNTTFFTDQLGKDLSVRILGKPRQELSIHSTWKALSREECPDSVTQNVELDLNGRARVPLDLGPQCHAKIQSIRITDGK